MNYSRVFFSIIAALMILIACEKPDDEVNTPETVTDIDGNVYQTVEIGDQVWMAENLNVTRYRNGDSIKYMADPTTWVNTVIRGKESFYCNYDNDTANARIYGAIYNGFAVHDYRSIAPEGWHIPTNEEWKELEQFLGMSDSVASAYGNRGLDEGGKLKATEPELWDQPNTGATNEMGFNALPGGYRSYPSGGFFSLGKWAVFWASADSTNGINASSRMLAYDRTSIWRNSGGEVYSNGYSVRCVKD